MFLVLYMVQCCICLEDIDLSDEGTKWLVCAHVFHSKCIDPVILNERRCPICRTLLEPTIIVESMGEMIEVEVMNTANEPYGDRVEVPPAPVNYNNNNRIIAVPIRRSIITEHKMMCMALVALAISCITLVSILPLLLK